MSCSTIWPSERRPTRSSTTVPASTCSARSRIDAVFAAREPSAPQRVDRQREHLLGRRVAVEQRFEAAVDRAGGRPRELLVADRPGQLGEVRAARSARCAGHTARPPPRSSRTPGARRARSALASTSSRRAMWGTVSDGSRPLTSKFRDTPYPSLARCCASRSRSFATGCGGGGGARRGRQRRDPERRPRTRPADQTRHAAAAYVAQAIVPQLAVYTAPGDASPMEQLANPWVVSPDYPDQTVPQVFLVKEQRSRRVGPGAPPRSTEREHRLGPRQRRSRSPRTTSTCRSSSAPTASPSPRAARCSTRATVAVGADATPTPTGEYYVRVKVKAIDPTTVYGPYRVGAVEPLRRARDLRRR